MAVIEAWDSAKAVQAKVDLMQIRSVNGAIVQDGYHSLRTLLHEAPGQTLSMATDATAVAVAPDQVFDYFDNVRKLMQEARQELFFVDRYLDADFASSYLPQVPAGVAVRLLTMDKKHLGTLVPSREGIRGSD